MNLSGSEQWYGITGYLTSETACNYLTTGWNFFYICQKWSDGSCVNLVGIPDHGSDCMSGGICILKENQKKQGFEVRRKQEW